MLGSVVLRSWARSHRATRIVDSAPWRGSGGRRARSCAKEGAPVVSDDAGPFVSILCRGWVRHWQYIGRQRRHPDDALEPDRRPRPTSTQKTKVPSSSGASPGRRDRFPIHRQVETFYSDPAAWRPMACNGAAGCRGEFRGGGTSSSRRVCVCAAFAATRDARRSLL